MEASQRTNLTLVQHEFHVAPILVCWSTKINWVDVQDYKLPININTHKLVAYMGQNRRRMTLNTSISSTLC